MEDLKDKKFIFIGGLHRSGTTVLAKILATDDRISNLYDAASGNDNTEGQFYQDVYPNDQTFGGVGRFAFRKEAHLTENSQLVSEENALKIYNSWKKLWDTSKEYLLEKTPSNLIMSRFLKALFPESYFVFIIRHPIATSLATQKWSKTSLLSLIKHWFVAHQVLLEDIKFLSDKFIIIRYEDMLSNPGEIFKAISAKIGLNDPQFKYSSFLKAGINKKYFEMWENLKNSATVLNRRIFKVLNFLERGRFPLFVRYDREIEDIVYLYEDSLNKFGYSFNLKQPVLNRTDIENLFVPL